ncbi:ATP-binding protein [Amycolatopsis taiwanensis]|uniref:Bacterial transcriptional activator domain-containing protein n=1 Tax=Amycolatopsis taiwanensis TaxID=342230 RepID=A0A9W6R817_9PSEU|nr:BTAD domain-containing putative transcriptional regulator [Amycolatopsis taiwanensis]GLY69287.1 hypothetical protein Atai01_59060 [Amycolatopsis taiwanensis]
MTTELILLSRVAYRDREISGPRLRGLLALLAGDLRSGCGTGRLVEGLWPDERPENPAKALQILVSRARAQLGPGLITRTATGYRLTLSEEQVDSSAVLLSAAASAKHARAGDHAAALAAAEAGLKLCSLEVQPTDPAWGQAPGPLCLPGVQPPDPAWGQAPRPPWAAQADTAAEDPLSRLRAERVPVYRALVRARALAFSRLGRHAEAVDALTALFREHPRDEEVLLELLRCEAATTGPSAALARYEEYRRSLRDELGSDPGAALQAAHRELLQETTPAVRHGVEHEPNPLLGRDDDLTAVANLLRSSRVTSIVGPGGLGKTRLAHGVSRQATERTVYFVALAGVTTDDDVAVEVASALGGGESLRGLRSVATDVVTSIAAVLSPAPALLVLDNCEHVIGGVAELVRALVSLTRDLRVLTTSRAPLGLSSESVYLLPELDLSTSVELFTQRARAARPGAELPPDVVTELCRHLDGLPLAVELAAARVRVMSVAEVARRLDDRFSLLRGGNRDAPARHRALWTVVEWSWNLLEPAGQAAMRTLSVFPGGFSADAARQLLGGADDVLEDLVDQSLLKVADTRAGARFRMLETVREFSTLKREEAGETDRVWRAFLSWARNFGLSHHDSPFGPDLAPATQLIRTEQDNLMQALRYALAIEDGATVAATAAVLSALWTFEPNRARSSGREETDRFLSHYRPEPEFVEVTRTAAALSAAYTFTVKGVYATRSLVILRRLPPAPPDTPVRAIAAILCALPELDPEALIDLCDSEKPLLAGIAGVITSYFWEAAGDVDAALRAAGRMLDGLDRSEFPWLWGIIRARLAELHMHHDQGHEALRHLRLLWSMQEELDVWVDEIGTGWGIALACLQIGEVDEAERWFRKVGAGSPDARLTYHSFGLAVRGECLLARGEIDDGLSSWRRAMDSASDGEVLGRPVEPGLEPWTLEIKAVAVVAHARHGFLDLVEETPGELADALRVLLTDTGRYSPSNLTGFPLCGALLLALAMVDFDRGAARSGARLVALAERFAYLAQFPTMSVALARQAAERGDQAAYAKAIATYAGLSRDELCEAALAALNAATGHG